MKIPNSQLSLGVWALVKNASTVNFTINSQNKPYTDTGHPFQQLSILEGIFEILLAFLR